MTTVTIDTSGCVSLEIGFGLAGWAWSDLAPFTQGYVEALFDEHPLTPEDERSDYRLRDGWAFSDLAPETLAAILKDCADAVAFMGAGCGPLSGAIFFQLRQQDGGWQAWRPFTVYLGDDGKVYTRESGQ